MKIYFAGSIRGGRDDVSLYHHIIAVLAEHGKVLTEHVSDASLTRAGEDGLSDEAIYERDMAWMAEADVVIAEVTIPSHGVGYEVARAELLGKPVLCLHRPIAGRRLSAMLAGNSTLRCETYDSVAELELILARFLSLSAPTTASALQS
ncbi:MAG: nucleoside 2-deoxyribosyltransferase [Chloroflexota bacterium]|nr:nucleoside 2-deoxyribosyltransferase [Chloroflexota bacterium]